MIYQSGLLGRFPDLPEVQELRKLFFSALVQEEIIQKEVMWISLFMVEILILFSGISRKMYTRF